jgi:hypothetical protein
MNLDTARKRPISGYEHPENINVNRNSLYKTFTENKKAKKNEKFGVTDIGNLYSKALIETKDSLCPICNKISINTCYCAYNDKTCESKHTWYTDREGKIINGNPHT